jgi:hypothetical protein
MLTTEDFDFDLPEELCCFLSHDTNRKKEQICQNFS